MAEWLYEEGIGEARAGLIEHGRLVEALIERETDAARAGSVVQGRLIATLIPKKRGVVRLLSGEEALLEPIPPRLAEGANVLVEILREAIAEEGRPKRAKARVAPPGVKPHPGPSLLQRIRATGVPVVPCPAHEEDRLEAHGWSELMEEATSGEVGTEAAALRLYLTPAMLLIDLTYHKRTIAAQDPAFWLVSYHRRALLQTNPASQTCARFWVQNEWAYWSLRLR